MLRVTTFLNRSKTQLQLQFNDNLDENIGILNVAVKSTTGNVSDLTVLSTNITDNILTINSKSRKKVKFF